MAVSIKVVSHSTNNMKEPSRMTPGMSSRLAARTRMTRRKRMVKLDVTIAKVKSLETLAIPYQLDVC
jgi:hypothetical protein